ncbi:hypothetical protein BaRGS_00039524, partial [Batillaria attramentaria]
VEFSTRLAVMFMQMFFSRELEFKGGGDDDKCDAAFAVMFMQMVVTWANRVASALVERMRMCSGVVQILVLSNGF